MTDLRAYFDERINALVQDITRTCTKRSGSADPDSDELDDAMIKEANKLGINLDISYVGSYLKILINLSVFVYLFFILIFFYFFTA